MSLIATLENRIGKRSRFSVNSGALPQADGHLPKGQRACKKSARVRGHEAEGGQLREVQLHNGVSDLRQKAFQLKRLDT